MLISSANSTNRYSSPPQLYRVLLGSSIGFGCSSRLFEPRLERGGMELSCREPWLAQQLSEQLRRRADALDDHLAESSPSALDCRLPVISPHDDLRDQRVIERRHLGSPLQPRVDPDPRARRQRQLLGCARCRVESLGWILGVDPQLDRTAARAVVALFEAKRLAGSDAQLLSHEI